MPNYIVKRDGSLEKWDSGKIFNAIKKAMYSTGLKDAESHSDKVAKQVLFSVNGSDRIYQEDIQNVVERSLMECGYYNEAKNFILWRDKRRESREFKQLNLDINKTIDNYLDKADWRVNENANMDYCYQGLVLNINAEVESKYCLNKYPEHIRDAHLNGYFHIHDLAQGLVGYCAGWSLYDLILEGFNLENSCSSAPSKHFDSILSQMINFIGTLQNEWAGAQAFSSVDTLLAPFVYYDGLDYKEVKQAIQRFVYNMNTTSRWGGQCPFSNVTFDLTPTSAYKNETVIIGGKPINVTYDQFQNEMDMINKAFLEVMLGGDYHNNIFSFPIPTYNITEDFDWDSEIGQLILKMSSKYGAPYFQNFINSDMSVNDVKSFCCRLQLDKRQVREQLKNKTNGLFGSGELTGSIGVVTLNLPRMAYLSNSKKEFFETVEKYARYAKESLEFKRKFVTDNLNNGLMPWTKRYLKTGFNSFFCTVGIVGGHEACLNLLGKGIETEEGSQFMEETLNYLRDKLLEYQKETGNMYNLEAVPAEGTSYKLAKLDKNEFPFIIASGEDEPYYTNSTQLPVDYTNDVFFQLEHQDRLQPKYTGGTVFHTFLGESVADPNAVKQFITKAFSMTKIPYLSITPTFSICKNHGYFSGGVWECPKCGMDTDVYTRVVGYYRPVSRFNKGKKEEYKERKTVSI